MSFSVAASAYDRFMGRFSVPLAPRFCDFAAVAAPTRVLDVGCGPGALTAELVRRAGAASVAAVDPSGQFVAAVSARHPEVEVRRAAAEELPFDDDTFDLAVAQLVVHFMRDPVAGLREMARVTRPGGTVAACVWDYDEGTGPLAAFWNGARRLDPEVDDESERAGTRRGQLARLFREAGLREVADGTVSVSVEHATFAAWWEPFTLGVGPAGAYVAGLDDATRAELRAACREELPDEPVVVTARAWAVRGRV